MKSKSRIGGAGVAGALVVLILAGCGGSDKPKATPTPGKIANGGYVPGDVSFGVLAPTTGAHAERGRDLVDGAEMAISELNVRGGVNGHKAALVTYDDGCDPKIAGISATMLKDSKAAGVVGGICEGATGEAARTLGSSVPYLITSANAPSLVSARRTPTAYLTNGTPYQSALAASHWFVFQRAQRLAILTQDDRASKFLGDQVHKLSSPVPHPTTRQTVPAGTTDWSAYVKTALTGNPDTVYWAGPAAESGALVKALRDAGYKGTFVASAESESPDFVAAAGPAGGGRDRDRSRDPPGAADGRQVDADLHLALQARTGLRRAAGLRGRACARAGRHPERQGRPWPQQ